MSLSETKVLKSMYHLIPVSSYVTISFGESSECATRKYTKFPLREVCCRKCVMAF